MIIVNYTVLFAKPIEGYNWDSTLAEPQTVFWE
jgi:hypothetical protein